MELLRDVGKPYDTFSIGYVVYLTIEVDGGPPGSGCLLEVAVASALRGRSSRLDQDERKLIGQ